MGTGPFKLVEYKTDVSITYERFDDYWQEGKPYLDGIEWLLSADATSALMSFKAGEAQVLWEVQPKDAASLEQEGYVVQVGPQGSTYTFFFDSANPDSPFSDVRVRQALCHAIDTAGLLEIGYGLFSATNQPYAPGFWPHNPEVVGYPYDPQKAKDLLAEAGYPQGFDTTLNMISARPDELQLAMQAYLSEVGINATINKVTGPEFSEMYVFKGWDGLINIFSGTWPRHPSLVERGATLPLADTGAASSERIPELLALFEQANQEPDQSKSAQLYKDLWKLQVDKYCTNFFAYYAPDVYAHSPAVHNMGLENVWLTLADCWLEK